MKTVGDLIFTLVMQGPVSGAELARKLAISPATLSRLVARAGPRVLRMGRTKGSQYCATRRIEGLDSPLPVFRISETGTPSPFATLWPLASGAHWVVPAAGKGKGEHFVGLPPHVVEMAPQGYLGRAFAQQHGTELGLSPRPTDWTDDHRLIALARRGEDCVGNLIVGREAMDRWLAWTPEEVARDAFPHLADASAAGEVGSSAGGENPKFGAFTGGRHVLVKFAMGQGGDVARRWQDLLVAEACCLGFLRQAGVRAAEATWFDIGDRRFLEVVRFDRVGPRGRRGVLSSSAVDNEYYGAAMSWTQLARLMEGDGRLSAEDAKRIRWLEVFGQLIGNTDRHMGNLSFLVGDDGALTLAPVYDMLPMLYAPSQTMVVDRPFQPAPPTTENMDVWPDAARLAEEYWVALAKSDGLSDGFRAIALDCASKVSEQRRGR
jgi:hypothetical protein